MRTVDDYSEYSMECLIKAETLLRFSLVGHPSQFRREQIINRLADIRAEIAFRNAGKGFEQTY